jgi:polysaccharide biosynthesis protein PslH
MKILQLCKKFPFPVKDGESLAITTLAQAFHALGHEVTLVAMNTTKHWSDLARLPDDFNHYAAVHSVDIDNRLRPLGLAHNLLFTNHSYHVARFEDEHFAQKLRAVLRNQDFDVVQVETIYLSPYLDIIRENSNALVVLRSHNVEHEVWERVTANSRTLKKWYLAQATPRLKRYELEHLNAYDLVAGITGRDVAHFQRLGLIKPAIPIPIGLDCQRYQPDYGPMRRPLSLSFLGSLDWVPNIEGLKWFLERVWTPLLAPAFPELTLHIAGRNTPDWLMRLQLPRVTVYGETPDAAEFLNRHAVMIAPILSGGGMRAKILEAMALGRIVLSTRLGMEGIDAQHGREAMLADTPDAFRRAIAWHLANPAEAARIGVNARAFCAQHFDNLSIAKKLLARYETMTHRKALIELPPPA